MDYQGLVDEQAAVMNVASLPVTVEKKGNAATDLRRIYINPSFASEVYSSSGVNGLRFVLAHELGHARAQGGSSHTHSGELAADRWAAASLARLGIGERAATSVLGSLNHGETRSHPGADTRISIVQRAHTIETSVRRRMSASTSAPRIPRQVRRPELPKTDKKKSNLRPPLRESDLRPRRPL